RYPRLRIFLSTTTIAGQQVARRSVQHVDAVFYFPFDFAFVVRRTLDVVNPRIFVMMETEIWPNLLRVCRKRGVKTVMINGRISSRSYPRYRLARPLPWIRADRKSTRLNSSHLGISYAVFCLKKKKKKHKKRIVRDRRT